MTDKPYRGHRADLTVYDDYADPFTEDFERLIQNVGVYPPKPLRYVLEGLTSAETIDNSLECDCKEEEEKREINYFSKLFLTKKEIEYLVEAGYPADMFVCLPEQAGIQEEEE